MAHVYAEEVHRIVDEAIEKAVNRIASGARREVQDTTGIGDEISVKQIQDSLPNIKWINIDDFSVEEGLLKIEEFLRVSNYYLVLIPVSLVL